MFGRSTLARLVTRVGLVNDVYLATAADNLTVRVTLLCGFDGGDDFHKMVENTVRPAFCQMKYGKKETWKHGKKAATGNSFAAI
jgi:hypothetical protein